VGRRLAPLLQYICESGGDYHACENLAETVLAAGPLAHFDTRPYVELFLQTIPFNHLHVWAIRQVLRKKVTVPLKNYRRSSKTWCRRLYNLDMRIERSDWSIESQLCSSPISLCDIRAGGSSTVCVGTDKPNKYF